MNRFPKCLALLLGLVSALGFAPLGWWPVTLMCLAALIHLVWNANSVRAGAARGYWFGVGHFTLGLNWIAGSFQYQDTMPHWLGWVAVVGLSFYLALFPALAVAAAKWAAQLNRLAFVITFAAAWLLTEMLRATLFTGFAWNPLGVIAVDFAWPSLVIGTYGLSALCCLFAGAVWMLAIQKLKASAAIFAGTLFIFGAGFGLSQLADYDAMIAVERSGYRTGPMLKIVQPNIDQQIKYDAKYNAANFQKLAKLSGDPSRIPRLILWPEAAVQDFLEEEPWARARLATLLGPRDMLLVGGDALVYDKTGRLRAARNSLFALTPDAKLIARYDKSHLVPYGEYLPMRPLLSMIGLSRLVPGDLDFVSGPGPRSFALPGFGKVGVQICYEIIFSGQVIDKANRPDFLFNPSNDAWFGSWGPPQHLAQARLRALEEGLPVVRSTPTGISAIIDANGHIEQSLPYGREGSIEQWLPRKHAPTLFARFGNILSLAFALTLGLFGFALVRKRR